MVLVCVKELNTRSRVHCSTSWDQFHSYGSHVQVAISRSIFAHDRQLWPCDRSRSSQRPRRHCCRTCTCTARRARKDQAAKGPKRFGLSRTRAAGRWKEHAPRAMAADAVQPTRSPLSRFGAAERRSREHGSDQIHDCQRADKQPTMPLLAKQLQPPSAAQAAKPGA